MELSIETSEKFVAGDIQNAFDIAMNVPVVLFTMDLFVNSLQEELPSYEVIKSGSHIAIHKENSRVAIIYNTFNV